MPSSKKPISTIKISEFKIDEVPLACSFLIVGPSGCGKTVFTENLIYYRKHLYPVAKIFIGSEDDYAELKEIFHPLFVHYGGNFEAELTAFVKRCQTQALKYPPGAMERRAILWFDDLSDDNSVWKTPNIIKLVKKSRHWDLLALWCTQACKDFPPSFRTNVAYVVIGRTSNEEERKKLYAFAGVCGNQRKFFDLMDQVVEKFHFLVIKQRSDSNSMEDCVFWYKTKPLAKWSFGSREYRRWGEARYNEKYVDEVD